MSADELEELQFVLNAEDGEIRIDLLNSGSESLWAHPFNWRVEVQARGFKGWSDPFIELEQLQHFHRELSALDKTLRGKATLSSVSPDELSLVVENTDLLGHLAVAISLLRGFYDAKGVWKGYTLHCSFDIELHHLTALREWCAVLTAGVK